MPVRGVFEMNERNVEQNVIKQLRKAGGEAYKFVSPGRRGVPDRLCLLSVPEKLRETIAKYIRFIEAKAPGKMMRPDQINEKKRLEELGYRVDIIDTMDWRF